MAEVAVTARAQDFCPGQTEAAVLFCLDVLGRDRRPETRPSRTGIELRVRAEQRRPACDTAVESGLVDLVVLPSESEFGPLAPHYFVLTAA